MKRAQPSDERDGQRSFSRATVTAFFQRAISFFGSGRNGNEGERTAPHETERHQRQTEIDQLLEQLEALYAELPERRETKPRAELIAHLHQTKQQLRDRQLDLLRFEHRVAQFQATRRGNEAKADHLALQRAGRLMRSPRFSVRCSAAAQLGQLQHPEALAILIEAKEDPDARVRVAVLDALAHHGSATAVEIISGFVNDENQQIRLAALRALAKLAPEASRQRLISALDDTTRTG